MTTNVKTETDNLVLFPASKNYPLESDLPFFIDSPMNDLRIEIEREINSQTTSFDSLEAFMNRDKNVDHFSSKADLALSEKIESIMEMKAKIKYYLEDLESYLPARRS